MQSNPKKQACSRICECIARRLAISSDRDIEVLTYTRAPGGLLMLPTVDTATQPDEAVR